MSSTLLRRWAEVTGELSLIDASIGTNTAVIDRSGGYSYRDVLHKAKAVAHKLRSHHQLLGKGSMLSGTRIGLLIEPGHYFVSALYGVWMSGGCVVVLSTLHPIAETEYFCADANVEVILVTEHLADKLHDLKHKATIISIESIVDSEDNSIENNTEKPVFEQLDRDAPALQLYTSGTTGKPKGAVISHENLAEQQELLRQAWGWRREDILLHTLPLHHMHGLAIAMLSAIGVGATVNMLAHFDAALVWDTMKDCTVFMAVPTIYAKLFGAYDHADDETKNRWRTYATSLRLATSGSAALPVTLAERWKAVTGVYPLERFGMTEIGVGTTNPLVGDRKPGTVGKPLQSVKTRIVGEDNHEAEVGELWIAGPSVFLGYHNRPEANDSSFVDWEGERWFRTGDTVTLDADGYVKILGRTSVDILKSGGYKLSALEIEEALREHPSIAEVAVIGVPDETWGEMVVACIVAKPGQQEHCNEGELKSFVRERLAPYKAPRKYVLMSEFPRNAVGKVMKPELRKRILG